jgi:peptidoglycan-N-acetylglucosamine deacetylase
MRERLCAVSVDLDEIPHYHAIHGLGVPDGSASSGNQPGPGTAVYDVALPRMSAWARAMGLPLTLFAVGADLARPAAAAALRALSTEGHEIANHSLDHLYDLTRRPRGELRRQVEGGAAAIAAATGKHPGGFRAPGYTVSDALFEVLQELGVGYDASVFPCPAYMLAKLGALAAIGASGRQSRSIAGDARVLAAPTRPYRVGAPYWRRGRGLVEVPVQVTRGLRLPFIGTALTLAPGAGAGVLARMCVGEPTVNLELHGLDFLEEADGLSSLAGHQADVRVPWRTKRARLGQALAVLRDAGYRFATMAELAASAAAEPGLG